MFSVGFICTVFDIDLHKAIFLIGSGVTSHKGLYNLIKERGPSARLSKYSLDTKTRLCKTYNNS